MVSIELQRINLVRIAHTYYTHQDIEKARQFLIDFGLIECHRTGKRTYYRGYSREPFVYCAQEGPENKFGGPAFVVESRRDLEIAHETIPGATDIYELEDVPGGGSCVTFHDPVDGFPFHLVHGQKLLDEESILPEIQFNFVGLHRFLPVFTCSRADRLRSQPTRIEQVVDTSGLRRVSRLSLQHPKTAHAIPFRSSPRTQTRSFRHVCNELPEGLRFLHEPVQFLSKRRKQYSLTDSFP